MEIFVELLKEFNIVQIFVIFAGMSYFYKKLDKKIDKLSEKIDNVDKRLGGKIEDIDRRLCRVEERVNEMDKRLCRIEGSLSTQGHCLFNQSKPDRKVE